MKSLLGILPRHEAVENFKQRIITVDLVREEVSLSTARCSEERTASRGSSKLLARTDAADEGGGREGGGGGV